MLFLCQTTDNHLSSLLDQSRSSELDGLLLSEREEIAPRFLLEFVNKQLSQDPKNSFWWSPRLIVVDKRIVGMCGFKSPPNVDNSVEIGYGIVVSQRKRGFATKAVNFLVKEAFSQMEVQTITAHTTPSNLSSCKVLEKNQFFRDGNKIDPDDGELWIWRKKR